MGLNYEIKEFDGCTVENNGERVISFDAVSKKLKASKELYGGSRQDKVDFGMMKKNLEELKKQESANSEKAAFVAFFENILVGAFCRYRTSKKKAWGIWHNVVLLLATASVPLISAGLVALFESGTGCLSGASTIEISVAITLGILAVAYIEWSKKKNNMETWVRHSSCYSRLNLLLQRYMMSKKTEQDYRFFVESTFAILEQNLDQFTLNLSANGLAERSEIEAQEDE